MSINRRGLVGRHDIVLTEPDARNPLSLGNGDFACGIDITGMQTFVDWHDPMLAMRSGRQVVNTATQSTWGWHSMPNPECWTMADAMSEYDSPRGKVRYPDKFDMRAMMTGEIPEEMRAGFWLNGNPQRLDLGRVGLFLGDGLSGAGFTTEDLSAVDQRLYLWAGRVESRFELHGHPVFVTTVVHPEQGTLAVRITSGFLAEGLGIALRFPYASDGFFGTSDWSKPERHTTEIDVHVGSATVVRTLDDTRYEVGVNVTTPGVTALPRITARGSKHMLTAHTDASCIELVVTYAPSLTDTRAASFDEVLAASADWWRGFWESGAAVAFDGTNDPRANELERRIVLSQYLTAVHSSGSMPPQETGLMTNSWQGKSHLEMHFWHAAHFAAWGRPWLLRRSMDWYLEIADVARATAAEQGYSGLRWPKQVGPDGRDTPSEIGPFLIWQQPHFLYLLELLHSADGLDQDFITRADAAVQDTAAFMVSFLEDRDGEYHLPAPLIPAQEFYNAKTTEDPTFELAYWWWGLELAQRWNERQGRPRDPRWGDVQARLARPHTRDGIYTAIATEPFTKRDDHPALLAALGVVPPNPLIDEETMRATLRDVLATWDWPSTWGWDFPVLAMTASALGEADTAIDALLSGRPKNAYLRNGHNPQMGNMLPIYLPGNGGLLAAVAQMVTGFCGSTEETPGFPKSWIVQHEGFNPWPA